MNILNKNITNIIHNYINYTNNNLIKLANKNDKCIYYSNKINVMFTPLFDLMLKCIELGYTGFYANRIDIDYDYFLNEYNNCKYNKIYYMYKNDKILKFSIDLSKSREY